MDIFKINRKSHIEIGEIYFWTATINGWRKLLQADEMKMMVIASLQWLKSKGLIEIYGYVIMPNHIHLIWEVLNKNGKESPHGSLLKFTAHTFKDHLKRNHSTWLDEFAVPASNKKYEFWKRDSLAVRLFSQKMAFQKLDYIHANPIAPHWQLAPSPEEYRFSSAAFYETGVDEFNLITHIREVF
ncbi:MAG TPA: transposase [Sphingobacteriaceae bacterium]